MESHKVVLHRVVFSVAMLLACLACSGPKPVAKGPDRVKELKEWVSRGVNEGVSIRTVAKGADARELARAWSDPTTASDERMGIAAWLLVQGGDAFIQDLWLDRLLETNRVRSEAIPDDAWTCLPDVLGAVYFETKGDAFLDVLIASQMDGAPAQLQGYALIEVFLAEPERLDALFAPTDSRPGAGTMRRVAEIELEPPYSDTAKALVALRDRPDLPNFRAFLSRLVAAQKQAEPRRK